MNEDYYPLIALVILLPIIISPITIEALEDVDDGEANGIVQFETARNFTNIKSDFQSNILAKINGTIQSFVTTNLKDGIVDINDDLLLYKLGINRTSGLTIYEMNVEANFSGMTTDMATFAEKLDELLSSMVTDIVSFLTTQDVTNAKSFIDKSTGEQVKREI